MKDDELYEILDSVNGVLIPGGGSNIVESRDFVKKRKEEIKKNKKLGTVF